MAPAPLFVRLEAARTERGALLCVGIDPRLERIPEAITGDVEERLARFGRDVIELTAEHAACFKVQIAFFEAHGLAGLRAYARIVAEARRRGAPVIGDVKRGDIGSTAAAYAQGHLRPGGDFEVDAITANPWLGEDSLVPLVDAAAEAGKGVYVLVRTSNPGAADLQDLPLGDGGRVWGAAAARVRRLAERAPGAVGAVVGATNPEAARAVRAELEDVPFLVPGYGAQGASAADVAACARFDGSGYVVNASRAIIHPPAPDGDWRRAVTAAARAAREDLYGAHVVR